MILDHCHRASCAQIIEALRAELEELTQTESALRTLLNVYTLGGWTDHERLAQDLAAMTKERDDASRTSEYRKSLALAIPNDSSALEARLAQEYASGYAAGELKHGIAGGEVK